MNSNKIGALSLTHFMSKALFLGIGISRIINGAKESLIFSLLLGILFGYLLLRFMIKFNFVNSNKLQKIIMFFLLLILLIVGFTEFVNLISSIYLIDTNKYIILIPLILTIIYLNTKPIEITYKISTIILFISFCIFFVIILALLPNIKLLNYFPLYKVELYKIVLTSLEFALYSVVPNIIFGGLIITNDKKVNNNILKNYLLSCAFLIIIFLLVQGILGVDLVKIFKFPEYIILKKIKLLDFINNVENIFSFLWLFTMYIYLNTLSKIIYDMSKDVFSNKYIYPIFLFVIMFFISTYLFDNIKYFLFLYNYLWIIVLIVIIIYICMLLNTLKKK